MTTPLLFVKQTAPTGIILDTGKYLKELREKILQVTNKESEGEHHENTDQEATSYRKGLIKSLEEVIMDAIIQSLSVDKNAEFELAISCLLVARYHLGALFSDDAKEIAEAMNEFGGRVREQLKQIGAYQKGYLFYSFDRLLGNSDVVLMRFEPPEIK